MPQLATPDDDDDVVDDDDDDDGDDDDYSLPTRRITSFAQLNKHYTCYVI